MPGRTEGLQPPLSRAERDITKSYDGWSNFMMSYGLKPHDHDDIAEAKQILSTMADHGQAEGLGKGGSTSSGQSQKK